MIKLSDDFECENDERHGQWILHEHYDGTDKDGKPKRQSRTLYYGSFYQICNVIIDRKVAKCESLEEIQSMLRMATAYELVRCLELPDIPKPDKRID